MHSRAPSLPGAPAASTRLDLHCLGLDDVHLVLVAAPDAVVYDGHAADGVVRVAQVHQVVVAQVPLAVYREPTTPAQARPGPQLLTVRLVHTPPGPSDAARLPTAARPHLRLGGRWPESRRPEPPALVLSRAWNGKVVSQAQAGPCSVLPDARPSAGGHVHQAQHGVLQLDGVQTLLPVGHG